MITQAAQDEMNAWVRQGRPGSQPLRPRIHLDVPARCHRGAYADVRWNVTLAQHVVLRVVPPGGVPIDEVVGVVGRRRVRLDIVGRYRVALYATAAPRHAARRRPQPATPTEAEIEVVPPPPTVVLEGNDRVTLGESARISWTVGEAESVRLLLDGTIQAVAPVGEIVLHPEACGERSVTITAQGQGGRTQKSLRLRVEAPPVVISAPTKVEAPIGDLVQVHYAITGARSAAIEIVGWGDEPRAIPHRGRIEVQTALQTERLRISAVGHDDRTHIKTVVVTGRLFDFLSIQTELKSLLGGAR